MERLTAFSILATLILMVAASAKTGRMCSEHPLQKTVKKGVLMRSWHYASHSDGSMYWGQSAYYPRYKKHSWVPVGDRTSTKYLGLDYFTSHSGRKAEDNFCTINLQRRGKFYLLVHARGRKYTAATLEGWNSEGWVEQEQGSSGSSDLIIGLGKRKGRMYVPRHAYVFSKVGDAVTIPTHHVIASKIRGLRVRGYWSVLIAEDDGSASVAPRKPTGMKIPPGGRCPDSLHDKWVTPGTDAADPQTYGKMFRTFHPLWDPCFWCAYDHEHGSDAMSLMGYAPKYGYTALKNGKEKESHKGFKDIVIRVGRKFVYYGIHAQMSKGRRFGARHHSKVIAVVDKRSKGKLEVELRFKADYGHREVRLVNGKDRMPLTRADRSLRDSISSGRQPRKQRLINVINPDRLDRRFQYHDSPNELRGEYEQWTTHPMCSTVIRGGEPTVDFKNMGLALKEVKSKPDDVVQLGRKRKGVFVQHPSTNREFRSRDFVLSDSSCLFSLPDIAGKPEASGKFYTDAFGKKLVAGPGRAACAQLVRPGFKLNITGRFQTTDTWYGLYEDGAHGSMKNIGFGIRESEN